MARVLAVANPSSRSGKTSTAFGLATMLCDLGQNVLAVYLDAHASLTRMLGIDAETIETTVYDVLLRGTPVLQAMVDTDAGPDLLPAALELSAAEAALVTRPGREHLLLHALEAVSDDYDWIVIDCASSMGLLTVNALAMADLLVVPVREHSSRALAALMAAVEEIRSFVNPRLTMFGIVPLGAALTVQVDAAVVMTVPAPPLALNAYREIAKLLLQR